MNTREARHQARLIEWEERVKECRGSGRSVKEWCEEKGIRYQTYYRWEREVTNHAGIQKVRQEAAAEPDKAEFARIRTEAEHPGPVKAEGAAIIRIGAVTIEVSADTDIGTVAALCQALSC